MVVLRRGAVSYGRGTPVGKVNLRLLEIGNSNSHGTRPFDYNHLDYPMDSDQVVHKDLSLFVATTRSQQMANGGSSK